ncbi:hypothetical protein HFP15_31075 [Amycolatopsis sp. K13G38]|uniref:ABC transporter ATP-binding protein n=1 Tax=Amycolatopsis acididurans TaxID=2724524 RepID=A0ABX1JC26_9PSEU|nr:hypothetical protein [Amycolatopsis acididurans]NKQ57318.1 hypothetical protein [Amycolatopsis acididurans]
MSVPTLLTTAAADDPSHGSALHTIIHDILPACALVFGCMAAIWLASAIIAISGAYLGGLAFLGVRTLIRACAKQIRRRRGEQYARLVTVDPDGVTAKVINLDRHRRRRHNWHNSSPAEDPESGPADGPA